MADLRLRLPSQRYFEEESDALPSPRDFGILMHKAFEHATSEEEIRRSVAQMQTDGVLSGAEAEALGQKLDEALADPVVREWFTGEWQEVRTESDIILPAAEVRSGGTGGATRGSVTRRPDRVMMRQGDTERQVVVVDYKFGEHETAGHRRQIGEYMRLLREMGYDDVKGYLWYVRLRKVVEVPAAGR